MPKGDLSITIPHHAVISYLHRPAIDLGRNLEVFPPVEVWLLSSELLCALSMYFLGMYIASILVFISLTVWDVV